MPRHDPKTDDVVPTPHKKLTEREIELAKDLAREDMVMEQRLPSFHQEMIEYARQRGVPYWRVVGAMMDQKFFKTEDGEWAVLKEDAEAAFRKWGLEEVYKWELKTAKKIEKSKE